MTDERARKDEYGMTWYTRQTLFNLARHPLGLRGTGIRGKVLVNLGYAKRKLYGVAITDEGVLLVAVLMLKGALSEPEPGRRPSFDELKAEFLAEWAAPSYQGAPPLDVEVQSDPPAWLEAFSRRQFDERQRLGEQPVPPPLLPSPGVLDDEP